MMIFKGVKLILFLATLSLTTGLLVASTSAATQTVNLDTTQNTTDSPLFNSDPSTTGDFVGLGISNNSSNASALATSVDSDINRIYTWRLSLSEPICSEATLQTIRLKSTASSSTEGDPDLSAMMLYSISPSRQENLGNYTVVSGVDYATSTGFATPPNNAGIYGIIRGSAGIFGGSIDGVMEGIWDISSMPSDSEFGVMIQQDTEDGTIDLQTTINEAVLAYDDTNCEVANPATPATTTPPTSPKTGLVFNLIIWFSILISSLALLFVAAKRLKKAH